MARRNILILSFLGVMAGTLALFQLADHPDAAPAEGSGTEMAVQVTVETIRPKPIVLATEYSGRVSAARRVEIRPQIGGLILERRVEEGTRISAGEVLFRIDPAPLKADLALAEAALMRAEATEAHARRAVERSDALLARKAISQQSNDTAHTDLRLAVAGIAEARAAVEHKRLDLDFATLRSPIGGYVAAGLADVGGLVTVGGEKALAVVQDLDKVYVDLRLPADDLDAILMAAEEGLGPVRILRDRDGAAPLTGVLKSSDVIVDPGTGYVSVRIETANPKLALLPGMFVRAELPYGAVPDALLVPEDAVLHTAGGGAQLVVVSPEGKARRRDVVPGARIGNRIIIASGLAPGEVVAIRGQNRVPEGVAVSVDARPAET
ncbi:efflux RND transporter periplasmic adaptor subunit [Rhodovulum sulfidophilum]|uniref:efflux RND transporter periplasmic adaptor subunit n=1 Tax=Rhodovulum sulfidophilum TaxID=35806 RepID=UPI001EEDFDEF|nr:efflux RND transporter periplasmic adaptor subunit [Rhodovulum sulfidophilum]